MSRLSGSIMILALILVSAMMIAGCTQTGTEPTKTTPVTTKATAVATPVATTPATGGNQTQIANPASENCVKLGGKLDIRKNADGSEYGVCTINGTECDEWALFRGECKPGAAPANVSANVTKPASNASANATKPATNATAGNATLNASKNASLNATVPSNATAANATKANKTT